MILLHLSATATIYARRILTSALAPVIEQALETAGLMLGSDKSRGYCLEMICADFLAGVSLEVGNRNALLPCLTRLVIGLPKPQRKQLLEEVQVTF
jgi:hypothetical protein